MASIGFLRPSIIRQNFPSAPTLTQKDIPDLTGNVYLITGANSGIGKELARMLYTANAKIYLACRTESKALQAIADIRNAAPESKGALDFISLDLGDLATVKPAAEAFLAKETKLNVLFNNAGVMIPPPGSKTAQGFDLELGTNCLGPFLFTQLLTPILKETAKTAPTGSTRVVWVASMATEVYSVKNGIDIANLGEHGYIKEPNLMERYGISKAGNFYHGSEYARRHKNDGIVSVALNPGNLNSDLYRHTDKTTGMDRINMKLFTRFMLYPVNHGACTELFAGLSPQVTLAKSGAWVGPFGQFFNPRKDLARGTKPTSEGGSGVAQKFWEWCEERVAQFA